MVINQFKLTSKLRARFCKNCEKGQYQDTTTQTGCKLCEKGTYQDAAGKSSCSPCDAGTYNTTKGATSCNQGYYMLDSTCNQCPLVGTTCQGGVAGLTCTAGYYLNGSTCSACADGMDLLADGTCGSTTLIYEYIGELEEKVSQIGKQKIILKSDGTFTAKNAKKVTLFLVGDSVSDSKF